MSEEYQLHSSPSIEDRMATLRSDLFNLAVLVVFMLIFVTAVLRWGDQLWDVIDGHHPEKDITALEGSNSQ